MDELTNVEEKPARSRQIQGRVRDAGEQPGVVRGRGVALNANRASTPAGAQPDKLSREVSQPRDGKLSADCAQAKRQSRRMLVGGASSGAIGYPGEFRAAGQ